MTNKYINLLYKNAFQKRIPLSCTLELTQACNLRCVHCFVSEHAPEFLSLSTTKNLINELSEMGCFFYTFTGGEALENPDFKDIWVYTKMRGGINTLFTNGLMVLDFLDFLKKYPPRIIELTMYGCSESTYAKVTRTKNIYKKVIETINAIRRCGLPLILKYFIVKENAYELDEFVDFANSNGLPYKFDYKVFPEFSSKYNVVGHQIDTDNMMNIDVKHKRYDRWDETFLNTVGNEYEVNNEWYNLMTDNGNRNRQLFNCGAGKFSCYITANAKIRMCVFLNNIEYDYNKVSVKEAWDNFASISSLTLNENSLCRTCSLIGVCDVCPAWGHRVNGDYRLSSCVLGLKEVANKRRLVLDNIEAFKIKE